MQDGMDKTLRAVRRNAGLRGLFAHLAIFAISFAFAFALNLDWRYFWLLIGWTLGLVLHGLAAIGPGQFIGARSDARRLRELLGDGEAV
jgi:hypothetical protein